MCSAPQSPPGAATLASVAADDLRGLDPLRRLAGRNRTKADILVYRVRGVDVAVKDYKSRPWLVRQTVGRFLIARESAAYSAAGALCGLPEFLGRIDAFALATRWVEARPVAESNPGELAATRFDRVEEIVAELHRRGIALADLHHRDVLAGADGAMWVVDLAAAVVLGPNPWFPRRRWFEFLCELDRFAVARIRTRFLGQEAGRPETAPNSRVARWHRRGRRIKTILNSIRGRK